METVTLPGPDQQLNTADDQVITLSSYTREIVIRDVAGENGQLRSIVVTISYRERPDDAHLHADHLHLRRTHKKDAMRNLSREDGFTITEMMVSTTVVLMVMAGALTTFKNALAINDSAAQLADANQNLRAGTNQLVRDLLMAGRIIGTAGHRDADRCRASPISRPGPGGAEFRVIADDDDATMQLPSITTGYQLGPTINNSKTDMITIMTVDEFMPVVTTPPATAGLAANAKATISADGTYVTFAATSQWHRRRHGQRHAEDQGRRSGALRRRQRQCDSDGDVDRPSQHRIYFASATRRTTSFTSTSRTRPRSAGTPSAARRLNGSARGRLKAACRGSQATGSDAPTVVDSQVTLFKALMITYYVDNTTTPGTPRLTRGGEPLPAAGARRRRRGSRPDLRPLRRRGEPDRGHRSCRRRSTAVTYTANQIRKVNVHVGVRSETISKPTQDYVRNHITTSVNVRSLAAVDKYPS